MVEVKTTIIHYGKEYSAIEFDTAEECNTFLTENEEYGMLKEEDGKIYIAKLKDHGKDPLPTECVRTGDTQ